MTPALDQDALLTAIANEYGTPVYVTDATVIDDAATRFAEAFGAGWIRQYSVKANHQRAVIAHLAARGWGANVVSLGEWDAARAAGMPDERISLEGIGKTDATMARVAQARAVGTGPAWVALESDDDIVALNKQLARHCPGRPVDVLLRLNPAVRPDTIAALAVGAKDTKFGFTADELTVAAKVLDPARLRLRGVHVHVGSQLASVDAWVDGVCSAITSLAELGGEAQGLDTLDVGGGFPVLPEERGPAPADFALALRDQLTTLRFALPPRRIVEPGRALVAAAGTLLTEVLHVRRRGGGQQVVLDAGMTELIRPALYGAHHPIKVVGGRGELIETVVDGPVCESADAFGRYRLPRLERGDRVAVGITGAYGSALASGYNGRPLAPEVWVDAAGSTTLTRPPVPAGF